MIARGSYTHLRKTCFALMALCKLVIGKEDKIAWVRAGFPVPELFY